MTETQRTVDIAVPAPGKVLVIDDSELVRGVIEDSLLEQGWMVTGAGSGEEGLALARSWEPEAVLCDLQMPGMDGYQVLRELRKLDPTLPVIFLSGDSDVSIVLRAVEEGAFDYRLKTAQDMRPLIAALGRAVNYCRLARENILLKRAMASETSALKDRLGPLLEKTGLDLRGPLEEIVAYAEGLKRQVTERPAESLLEDIRKIELAGRGLLALIDEVRAGIDEPSVQEIMGDVRKLVENGSPTMEVGGDVEKTDKMETIEGPNVREARIE